MTPASKTTDDWPLQRFNWTELVVEADKEYMYRVVSLTGTYETPQRSPVLLTTDKVARQDTTNGTVWYGRLSNRGISVTQASQFNNATFC